MNNFHYLSTLSLILCLLGCTNSTDYQITSVNEKTGSSSEYDFDINFRSETDILFYELELSCQNAMSFSAERNFWLLVCYDSFDFLQSILSKAADRNTEQ